MDFVFSNDPDRFQNILIKDIGLSDRAPVFGIRLYERSESLRPRNKAPTINYRYMKI